MQNSSHTRVRGPARTVTGCMPPHGPTATPTPELGAMNAAGTAIECGDANVIATRSPRAAEGLRTAPLLPVRGHGSPVSDSVRTDPVVQGAEAVMQYHPQRTSAINVSLACLARMRDQHMTSAGWRPESASQPPGGRAAALAGKCMSVLVAVYCAAASATSTINTRF